MIFPVRVDYCRCFVADCFAGTRFGCYLLDYGYYVNCDSATMASRLSLINTLERRLFALNAALTTARELKHREVARGLSDVYVELFDRLRDCKSDFREDYALAS